MKRLSVAGVLLLAAALWGGYLWVRHVGVVMERQRREADSLHTAQAVIASQSNTILALQDANAAAERQRHAQINREQAAVEGLNRLLRTNAASFRGMLADSLRIGFDSLEAAHRAVEANLGAQRDSALAGWALAASARDTLAALLRASQQQTQALNAALVAAQRKPFFERGVQGGIVKVARLGLEVRGFFAFVTGR